MGDSLFACGGTEDGSMESLSLKGVKKWVRTVPMPTPRQMFGMSTCRGGMYVVGGSDADDDKYEDAYV